jgi:hypothetical protein
MPRSSISPVAPIVASQGSQNAFELGWFIRRTRVMRQTRRLWIGEQELQPPIDSLCDGLADFRKNRHGGNSKDKLDHEHFSKLRRSCPALDVRDMALVPITDHVSQFSLRQTETASKKSHQVSVA